MRGLRHYLVPRLSWRHSEQVGIIHYLRCPHLISYNRVSSTYIRENKVVSHEQERALPSHLIIILIDTYFMGLYTRSILLFKGAVGFSGSRPLRHHLLPVNRLYLPGVFLTLKEHPPPSYSEICHTLHMTQVGFCHRVCKKSSTIY